jgi:hypothetical protein
MQAGGKMTQTLTAMWCTNMSAVRLTHIPYRYIGSVIYTIIGNLCAVFVLVAISCSFKNERTIIVGLGAAALSYKWLNDIFDCCTICQHVQTPAETHVYASKYKEMEFILYIIHICGITDKQFNKKFNNNDVSISALWSLLLDTCLTYPIKLDPSMSTSQLETQLTLDTQDLPV